MRIRTAIFGVYVLASAVGLAGLMWFVLSEVRPRHVALLQATMNDAAKLVAGALGGRDTLTRERTETWSVGVEGLKLEIWDETGRLVAPVDTAAAPAEAMIMVETPIYGRDGAEIGRVRLSRPRRSVNAVIWAERRKLAAVALVVAGTMLVAGWWIAHRLTVALGRLANYARAVRAGDDARPPTSRATEIAALGNAFEAMRRELEGKAYIERYTQALTHEIKSPLAGVRGAMEILEEDPPPEERARFFGHLRAETERMGRIVDRMLELTALESRREPGTREDVELGRMLIEQVAALRGGAEARQVRWELSGGDAEIVVFAERFLLGQAVFNLLQNAVEFSPRGGRIAVRITRSIGWANVVVEDDGAGVPAYALDRVFERFYSLPRPFGGRKSTGLGLPLVREIARLHGGEVSLGNRSEGGARAELRLPCGL